MFFAIFFGYFNAKFNFEVLFILFDKLYCREYNFNQDKQSARSVKEEKIMKKSLKVLALVLSAALIAACFAGCGDSKETKADTIKIGGIGPITGGAAVYGQAVKNAAEMAVEEINAAGGINGTMLEFNFQDDEHDPEKSVNAYNNLKDWGMQALMGTVTTSPCLAVVEKTHEDNMFQLTPSASATGVIKYDNVFQMCFTDPNQGTKSADYIAENKLATKVAVIYNSSDAYSSGIYNNFAKEAKEKGIEVVSAEAFTDDSKTDFSVQLNKSKASGAELVFLPIYAQEASQILEQANSMGYQTTFFGCDGLDGILAIEGFNKSLAEGVILLTPFVAGDTKSQANVDFTNKFKEKYKDTPNQFAADAYDAIYIIAECMKSGNVTADMSISDICGIMKTEMTKVKYDGLTGEGITFAADGSVNKSPNAMKIQNGEYVPM